MITNGHLELWMLNIRMSVRLEDVLQPVDRELSAQLLNCSFAHGQCSENQVLFSYNKGLFCNNPHLHFSSHLLFWQDHTSCMFECCLPNQELLTLFTLFTMHIIHGFVIRNIAQLHFLEKASWKVQIPQNYTMQETMPLAQVFCSVVILCGWGLSLS